MRLAFHFYILHLDFFILHFNGSIAEGNLRIHQLEINDFCSKASS